MARRSDPNDWKSLQDDVRIDLGGIAYRCVARVLSELAARPLIVALCVPPALTAVLHYQWKHGRHNDIPFNQFLRFQYRLKTKAAGRAALFLLSKARSFGLVAVAGGKVAAQVLRRLTPRQAAVLFVVAALGVAAMRAGFGAVYTLALCFAVVLSNLGQRKAGEASAYTVFNNFEYLEGELRMEQVEAELRHQPIAHGGVAQQRARFHALQDAPDAAAHGGVRVPTGPSQKLGRNDRVEVVDCTTGERKMVKSKVLQSSLDRGWAQTADVRYEGVRYRGAGQGGGGGQAEEDSDSE
mmetsp:Transcript_58971/g.140266  ORF Transcript_58971/g.140266 Transcript_58971/m.140266 type:complete len:296 (-) Transcript_58971:42-929(-)